MIINAGIRKIYYRSGYSDPLALEMIEESGVELVHLESDG
jgi:dCMP deaminase